MVGDDKIVLETYEDDDEWTLDKFASNSSLCDLEQILAKDDLSLRISAYQYQIWDRAIHPKLSSGSLYSRGE